MRLNLALVLTFVAVSAGPAFCNTISFTGANGVLGTSQSYGSVTAYGFSDGSPMNQAVHLYGKNGGGSETGVGIANNTDYEINDMSFVQLDVSSISEPFTLSIGSTQDQEGFSIFASNTLGTMGELLHNYNDPNTDPYSTGLLAPPTGDRFISIQADGNPDGRGNVLLDGLTTATTPEPSSLILLCTGILGSAGLVRRKLLV